LPLSAFLPSSSCWWSLPSCLSLRVLHSRCAFALPVFSLPPLLPHFRPSASHLALPCPIRLRRSRCLSLACYLLLRIRPLQICCFSLPSAYSFVARLPRHAILSHLPRYALRVFYSRIILFLALPLSPLSSFLFLPFLFPFSPFLLSVLRSTSPGEEEGRTRKKKHLLMRTSLSFPAALLSLLLSLPPFRAALLAFSSPPVFLLPPPLSFLLSLSSYPLSR